MEFSLPPAPCRTANDSGRSHRDQVCRIQPAPRTRRQIVRQIQTADARAVQRFHPVTHGCHHAFDLVVFAFGQGQTQMVRAHRLAGGSTHGLRVIVEHHTGQQALSLHRIQRVLDRHFIHLGHMVAW